MKKTKRAHTHAKMIIRKKTAYGDKTKQDNERERRRKRVQTE